MGHAFSHAACQAEWHHLGSAITVVRMPVAIAKGATRLIMFRAEFVIKN